MCLEGVDRAREEGEEGRSVVTADCHNKGLNQAFSYTNADRIVLGDHACLDTAVLFDPTYGQVTLQACNDTQTSQLWKYDYMVRAAGSQNIYISIHSRF